MRLFYFLLTLLLFPFFNLQAQQVSKTPEPDWVIKQELDHADIKENPDASGSQYVLVDFQDNFETKEFYKRFAFKVLNSKGVEDMSDISIDFDPSYQKLSFHYINIYRDGVLLQKLNTSDFKIIQRETESERNLYNGTVTAVNHLTDVRAGDVIDYAYTHIGANPVHKGKFAQSVSFQYDVPVDRYHFSMLIAKKNAPKLKKFNDAPSPKIQQQGDILFYEWSLEDLEAILYEANTPYWYNSAPRIEVSQFKSWEEISEQYGSFYKITPADKSYLTAKAKELKGAYKDETITNLIRFVQDEVRYLGFEDGQNGFVPSSPKEVYERRFGDCKDKSFLLAELLKTQSIDANPVLVNSSMGNMLEEKLPSPFAFDHCIVQIKEDGFTKYIDPTISYQGNSYKDIYFPDYKKGLVLATAKELITLPQPEKDLTEVIETYELDEIGGGAKFEVKTIYHGSNADFQRAELAYTTNQSLQQSYLEYYSSAYPGISVLEDMKTEDNRDDDNTFVVKETYRIDSLWVPDEENDKLIVAYFEPLVFESYIFPPSSSSSRKSPYYISPTHFSQKMIIYTPEAWNIQDDHSAILNKAFAYNYDVTYKNAKIEIDYKYRTFKDQIEPNEVTKYLEDHKKIQNATMYGLTYNKNLLNRPSESAADISWLMILIFFAAVVASAIGWVYIYKNYDLPAKGSVIEMLGIDGWLILFAIGLVLSPILIFITGIADENYFSATIIEMLLDENFFLFLVIVFELLFNTVYFTFSIFMIVIFFKQRSIVPRMAILFLAFPVVINIIDFIIVNGLFSELSESGDNEEFIGTIVGSIIRAAIWIPYFMLSSRVKRTFVKTIKPAPLPQELAEERTNYNLENGE